MLIGRLELYFLGCMGGGFLTAKLIIGQEEGTAGVKGARAVS